MPDERAARVAELFKAAIERDETEWPDVLDAGCDGDAELRAEVESLLEHHRASDEFLEQNAVEAAAESLVGESTLQAGDQVEQYRIESLIGTGGMGEVYLATDTNLKRKVALKLVQRGMNTQEILRRFRQEETILAGLNHPNIAQLYGTGLTSDGIPLFAMEYVEGMRLDQFCAERNLSVVERLQLFRKICSAVSYAHQHLVIHRDLKPANIRVTAEAEPKLLDFGIAKLLDEVAPEQTITLQSVMTPEYASPEQVRGQRMTTASDIYSLGVVLYELLTGEKPYRLTSRRPEEITRAITEQEPQRLKSLPGDLINIVLMALRKEPERRYASVAQFSDDVCRYLEGRPVLARKDTVGYRASKFIRRNKVGVAAAALVVISLTGGIVVSTYEARRAQNRFNDVRRLANSLMFEIHDSVADLQGSTPTRRLIVQRALEYLDRLNSEGGSDPSLQRELATAYEKVGDIQGNPYNANLGDTEGALVSYRKAAAIRERIIKRDQTPQARVELARSYRGIGDIMEQKGDAAECLKNYRESLAIVEQLAASHGNDPAVQDELARAYETLGDGLARTEDNRERERVYRQTLEIRTRLLEAAPNDRKLQRSTALALMKVAGVPGVSKEEAVADMTRAIAMLEALAASDPENARARRDVGFASYQLGMILTNAQDHEAALPVRQRSLQFREALAANDPKNRQARFDLATAHGDLAETLTALRRSAEALPHARTAVDLMKELASADATNAIYSRNLGLAWERLAAALETGGSIAEACDAYTQARGVFSSLRQRGALMPNDVGQIEKFSGKIAALTDTSR